MEITFEQHIAQNLSTELSDEFLNQSPNFYRWALVLLLCPFTQSHSLD